LRPGSTLLDRRLIFVLGKGGVGKTTVSAALGLCAARRGARTVVVELGARTELGRLFGVPSEPDTIELAPRLHATSANPRGALEQYLRDQLPLRLVADLIGTNRTVGYLTAAAPGLRELLCAGKIWELAQPLRRSGAEPYDLVVVDAPATGHGIALLTAAKAFVGVARSGPIERHAARINAMFTDPQQTAMVGIATPHDAAVTELGELQSALRRELPVELFGAIVNAVQPARFAASDAAVLRRALAAAEAADAATRAAIEVALAQITAVAEAAVQIARVGELTGLRALELPLLQTAAFGTTELEALAAALDAVL
jgi:anion-transporting  ArsA/GET3 family ATPase